MPAAAAAVFAFVGGLLAGSFATAVAHRVPRGMSIAGPRSQCPRCGAQIHARDNVPLFSWLFLRGRARCCGAPISPLYPLAELTTGILFAAIAVVFRGDGGSIAIDMIFSTMLVAITLTDLELRIIPNKILAVAVVLCLAITIPTDPSGVPERLIAAVAAGGLLFVVVLINPRGMGLGDVKLAATMGLFLGRAVAPALLAALLLGSAVGVAIIARHGAEGRKMAIPFGPFLAVGGVFGMFAGADLLNLYLGLN